MAKILFLIVKHNLKHFKVCTSVINGLNEAMAN